MKKWKCTVCGYIHTGDEPPEKCPVCGADKSKFVEVTDEEIEAEAAAKAEKKAKAAPAPEAKKKDEPAEKSQPGTDTGPAEATFRKKSYDLVTGLMIKHHAHPILVHIPNGVLPITFIMALIAGFFQLPELGKAVFYNLFLVTLTMPVVLFSGFLAWKRQYRGARTKIFITKITAAIATTALTLALLLWLVGAPRALTTPGERGIFLLVFLGDVFVAGVAGFIGGKLVFKD